ncbi:MAG: glycosyltransferase family 4 protein [Deltaproteobacteria bacterium]|nr:glycosyltransferase family 4 protein [Deltaproteobacteria bacterium]
MKVLALTKYGRAGASSRVRFLQFIPALAAAGIEVTPAPLFDAAHLVRFYRGGQRSIARALPRYVARLRTLVRARSAYDCLWLEGELFPYLPAWGERRSPLPYVVDYDDAVFHKYDTTPLIGALLGKKIAAVMRGAAVVSAGSPYVADEARRAGARRVELVPTVVDLAHYPLALAPGGPELRVGWIGTPHTARYLSALAPALARAARVVPLRLVVVGADVAMPGIATECHPWSEEREAALIASFDVGVMPLPDEPWERGKSGYKLIQCMASARPVIASPVGVNVAIVDGVGRLAGDEEAWVAALVELGRSAGLRAELGAAGRTRVEERYSLEVATPRLVELLRGASRSRSA